VKLFDEGEIDYAQLGKHREESKTIRRPLQSQGIVKQLGILTHPASAWNTPFPNAATASEDRDVRFLYVEGLNNARRQLARCFTIPD
jgi:hypothetical protein